MQTYKYPKSRALFERANKVIPAGIYGHLGPSGGVMIPSDAYPYYAARAKDSYFWDVDGNRFIDLMCAYGPNVLGYNNDRIDAAYQKQMQKMSTVTLAGECMVDLAELMVDTVASADWAFFCKNGGDVTNFAGMIAKAATHRDKIVKFVGGYHGVQAWMQAEGHPGITSNDVKDIITIPLGDLDAFEECVKKNARDIAGVITTPYYHGAFTKSYFPENEYWSNVRKICDNYGILLIIDDVRCGFRMDTKGSDHYIGIKADLITFSKAIANGYAISALCGQKKWKAAASNVFYTGSFWLSAGPMAASIETIKMLREFDSVGKMNQLGLDLEKKMKEASEPFGIHLEFSGMPSMFYLNVSDDPDDFLKQKLIGEIVKRGVFMTNHHNHFINCSLKQEDIDFIANVVEDACKVITKN